MIIKHPKNREYFTWRNLIRKTVAGCGDFRVYTENLTARAKIGIFLILLSYAIGWPAIAVLGMISGKTGEPLILVVGGPLMYGLSYGVFIIGAYIAGKEILKKGRESIKRKKMNELIQELKVKMIETLNLVDVAPGDIKETDQLIGGELGLDSIDVLELVMMLEKDYGAKIDSKELGVKVFATVASLAEYIQQHN